MASDDKPRVWILFCFMALLGNYAEGRPMDYTFNSILNGAAETFSNIYDPVANHTKVFLDDVKNRISNDPTFNSIVNGTTETFSNIYDPVANHTKDFLDDVKNRISNDTVTEGIVDQIKNCSIVIGGSLAGAAVGILAVLIIFPLALCLLGFTCCGIMAGSAAACCQSSIGDVSDGSCFACVQSLGAGGGLPYLIVSCIVGIPIGLYVGGLYTETYFHCFTS